MMESTSKLVELNGVPARVWEGATESGIPCHVFVTRIAVEESQPPEAHEEFRRELEETKKPSAQVEAYPLWMIL